MNGVAESLEDKLKQINEYLDKYEANLGIPQVKFHNDAEQYFNMSQIVLVKLTAEECDEAAIVLSQYSFHLQRAYNKELAVFNWLEEILNLAVNKQLSQYTAPSAAERKLCVINGDDYANKLNRLRLYVKLRIDKISYLSNKVEHLANTFKDMKQTRRRKYNGGN